MRLRRLWPCKDIDISWSDVLYALWMCLVSSIVRRENGELEIQTDSSVIPCISVRAAFDLYLSARTWKQGDECIFVGVNVPEMSQIAESHGLSVCGTDIDPLTTQANLSQLRANITHRTRFIVIPHLFGHRLDLREVIELANARGLDVVEDCAQAFSGSRWWGTQGATLSLFSFGPMKTATALQGGVAIVRDSELAVVMRNELATHHRQPTWRYLLRVVRFGLIKIAAQPFLYGFLVRVIRKMRINHEDLIHKSTKSSSSVVFSQSLNVRPCSAVVRVIARRVEQSDERIQQRIAKGRVLHAEIGNTVPLVLRNRRPNSYWMIPVLVDDSDSFKNALRNSGYDALSGRLAAVGNVDTNGAMSLEKSVMLPFSPQMSDAELEHLGEVITNYALNENELRDPDVEYLTL
ncbi:MAG: DegT/DnrJ/EryC1/StrS family aminotransferase [Gammaproteobacteria bacterium]|nr:DegT/DnrJ/EryC1/StrS family aminotransferase [Gammaproteobacteria bacterium]